MLRFGMCAKFVKVARDPLTFTWAAAVLSLSGLLVARSPPAAPFRRPGSHAALWQARDSIRTGLLIRDTHASCHILPPSLCIERTLRPSWLFSRWLRSRLLFRKLPDERDQAPVVVLL